MQFPGDMASKTCIFSMETFPQSFPNPAIVPIPHSIFEDTRADKYISAIKTSKPVLYCGQFALSLYSPFIYKTDTHFLAKLHFIIS